MQRLKYPAEGGNLLTPSPHRGEGRGEGKIPLSVIAHPFTLTVRLRTSVELSRSPHGRSPLPQDEVTVVITGSYNVNV